jgi:hypothetical protein
MLCGTKLPYFDLDWLESGNGGNNQLRNAGSYEPIDTEIFNTDTLRHMYVSQI